MAWNPSPEVAVARDAAKRMGEIVGARIEHMVVIFTTDANSYGMATYGPTKALCAEAGSVGDFLFRALGQYMVGVETESDLRREVESLQEEVLKAIADPEHCLTENTVDGLRGLASGALEEYA